MTMDAKFKKVVQYLWNCPTDFCLIYQVNEDNFRTDLKLYEATSLAIPLAENCVKLAGKYQKLATYCYEHKQSKILREHIMAEGAPSAAWLGLKKPTGRDRIPVPTNSLGQRWWHIVIASGPVRKAGYVIVARVAAKRTRELFGHIAEIQCITADAGSLMRLQIKLLALLGSMRNQMNSTSQP